MKYFVTILCIILFISTSVNAQDELDLSSFGSVKDFENEFEDFNNGFYSGSSALTWTDGSAPSLLGIEVSVFTGWGTFKKNEAIGLKEDGVAPFGAGLQAALGTAGFEFHVRYLPEFELSGFKNSTFGAGLKYDISSFLPAPGLPSFSLFADYIQSGFVLNDKQSFGGNDIKKGIDITFSTINIGTVASYDLVITRIYGRLGVELGTTDLKWNFVDQNNNFSVSKESGDISSTGFRYAVGVVLFGFRAEAGGRGSNLFFGLGYGIGI